MSVTAYTKLSFNSVVSSVTTTTADYQLNFVCPNCKTENVLSAKTSVIYQASKVFDSNQKVTFTLTCCGAKIELFVAIHKSANGAPMRLIQKSSEEGANGIRADWWKPWQRA